MPNKSIQSYGIIREDAGRFEPDACRYQVLHTSLALPILFVLRNPRLTPRLAS